VSRGGREEGRVVVGPIWDSVLDRREMFCWLSVVGAVGCCPYVGWEGVLLWVLSAAAIVSGGVAGV